MTRLPNAAPKPRRTPKRPPKPLKRSRVKSVNAKRRSREFVRAFGSDERVAWVRALDCFVSYSVACGGPIENAHTESGGAGRRADARFIVPLCRKHHRQLHELGADTFGRAYKVDIRFAASRIEEAWQRHLAASPNTANDDA